MNELSNAFSLLEVDVADEEDLKGIAVANNGVNSEGRKGKGKKGSENHGGTTLTNDENDTDQRAKEAYEEYRLPLVWIDLEMTGLNVEVDRILEIACIVTDGNLTKSIELMTICRSYGTPLGVAVSPSLPLRDVKRSNLVKDKAGPDLVIHQTEECLDKMGEWCQSHHGESGLTKRVLKSKLSEEEAEERVVEFVKKHVGSYTPLLAGNSVYVDLLFLKKYMPKLASLFPHVLVDVSSLKALCIRWYPRDNKKAPQKTNKHRAMDDIKESIAELKFYKDNIFKLKSRK